MGTDGIRECKGKCRNQCVNPEDNELGIDRAEIEGDRIRDDREGGENRSECGCLRCCMHPCVKIRKTEEANHAEGIESDPD